MQKRIRNISRIASLLPQIFRHKRIHITQNLASHSAYSSVAMPEILASEPIGVIAGNGAFPILFAQEAKARGHKVFAVCHLQETDPQIEEILDGCLWIKLGQLGALIQYFIDQNIKYVVMAGGISRVKHFGDVKLDMRGTSLLLSLRSTKDDVIMRGIAQELLSEGIQVIPCTIFMKNSICPLGVLTSNDIDADQKNDIAVGVEAIKAMSSQDIGQLVAVREGTIVAVEAIEGSNETIKRAGILGGKGVVIVKCAKPTQDMRFDVPTIGLTTIEVLQESRVSVLALEAGRSIILDKEECVKRANDAGITIIGIEPIVNEVLG